MIQKNKRVCIADWDGTLSDGYTALHWIKHLSKLDFINKKYIEEFQKQILRFKQGHINYRKLVIMGASIVARSLKGKKAQEIDIATNGFSHQVLKYIYPFVFDFIHLLKEHDIKLIVISGAPKKALDQVCKKIGVDELYAFDLNIDKNNLVIGDVSNNYGLIEKKQEIVNVIVSRYSEVILGMGNSDYDSPILEAAKNKLYMGKTKPLKLIPGVKLISPSNALGYIQSVIMEE